MKTLRSFVASLLLVQIAASTVAPVWAYHEKTSENITENVSDSPSMGDVVAHEVEALDQVLQGQSTAYGNRLDHFGLFDWEAPEANSQDVRRKARRYIDPRNLTIRLVGENGSLASADGRALTLTQPQKFEILYRGEALLKSRFPVSAIALYKNYLVFLEPGQYYEDPAALNPEVTSPLEKSVQPLSFVDLKAYAQLLGGGDSEEDAHSEDKTVDPREATLPIFSVPVAVGSQAQGLVSEDDQLKLLSRGTEALVPAEVLESFSKIQQTALDVTAALVNPKTYETAGPAVQEAERYFLQAIHLAGQSVPAQVQRSAEFAARMSESLQTRQASLANLKADPAFSAAVTEIQNFTISQQKATTRLNLLWQRLSLPKPMEGPKKIREALAMMVTGLRTSGVERAQLLREGSLQLISNRYVRWGVAVAAAATLGALYPEQVSHFLFEALDVSRVVLHAVVGKARGMGELFWEASRKAFDGFTKPHVFYQAYLAPEKRLNFLVGVLGYFGTALTMLAVPFLPVNMWLAARDLHRMNLPTYGDFRDQGQSMMASGISTIKARVDGFIQRQQNMRAQYFRDQEQAAADRARAQGREVQTHFTKSDEAQLDQIFQELKINNKNWMDKAFGKVAQTWKLFRSKVWKKIEENPGEDPVLADENPDEEVNAEENLSKKEIHTFGAALRSFIFSAESIGDAARRDVRAWNAFTIFRSAFLSPTMFYKMLTAPNFFNIALGDGRSEKNELTVPSPLNGGLISPLEAAKRVWKVLTFDQNLEGLHAWEDKIISVEKIVMKEAIHEGYRALIQYIGSRNESLEAVIRAGGVDSMTDSALQTLTLTQRTFFRSYVDDLMTRSMQMFLAKVANKPEQKNLGENSSLQELKQQTLSELNALQITSEEAKTFVRDAAAGREPYQQAQAVADFSLGSTGKWIATNSKYRSLNAINPAHDRTMRQIQVTLRSMEEKDAMPRALRAVLPQVLMKKSIGFFFTLVGLAGITAGALQPLHPELFGPNSFFHLGRVPFVAGNLVGLFITLFEGIPHKLQRDAEHSAHFGAVPEGEDAKRGLLRWYFKQTFANQANNYVDNQKLHWKIFFGQLKPAFVMSIFAGLASLGRFDLDGFATYLFLGAANPTNGLDVKLEQGMEYASHYHLKDFPERYRNHPRVLEYLTKKQAGLRFWFAFWEKIWVDAKGLVLGLTTRMNFQGQTQAFTRLLDPEGLTPTERVYSALERLKNFVRGVPGGTSAINGCESLLTKNYEDWQKVVPPGVIPSTGADKHHGH